MQLFRQPVLMFVALLALFSASAQAQPAEDCTGADLGSGDMFPLNGQIAPSSDDFSMTGTGCLEQGVDSVVCFTPTNNCTVTVSCEGDSGTQSANLFVGPCNTSPGSCTNSTSGSAATIAGIALTAGQNVCLVCEHSSPTLNDVIITEDAGSCGALPVALQSFEVESSD